MMKVWVAIRSYDYDGSEIISVHKTKEGAQACLDETKAADDGRAWSADEYIIQEHELKEQ